MTECVGLSGLVGWPAPDFLGSIGSLYEAGAVVQRRRVQPENIRAHQIEAGLRRSDGGLLSRA
jgi:hypothetical protein